MEDMVEGRHGFLMVLLPPLTATIALTSIQMNESHQRAHQLVRHAHPLPRSRINDAAVPRLSTRIRKRNGSRRAGARLLIKRAAAQHVLGRPWAAHVAAQGVQQTLGAHTQVHMERGQVGRPDASLGQHNDLAVPTTCACVCVDAGSCFFSVGERGQHVSKRASARSRCACTNTAKLDCCSFLAERCPWGVNVRVLPFSCVRVRVLARPFIAVQLGGQAWDGLLF